MGAASRRAEDTSRARALRYAQLVVILTLPLISLLGASASLSGTTDIGGAVPVALTSVVLLVTGAANHDDRQYADPEAFDIHRTLDRPVGFGFGVHLCIGAALARLETRVAFDELLTRFPDFGIDESGVVRMRAGNVRGLANLPVLIG